MVTIKYFAEDLLKTLEESMQMGKVLLIEEVRESLTGPLEPYLKKQFVYQKGNQMVKL